MLVYEKETGLILKNGKMCGFLNNRNMMKASHFRFMFQKKMLDVSRAVWMIHHKRECDGPLWHKNGYIVDNRLENLSTVFYPRAKKGPNIIGSCVVDENGCVLLDTRNVEERVRFFLKLVQSH